MNSQKKKIGNWDRIVQIALILKKYKIPFCLVKILIKLIWWFINRD